MSKSLACKLINFFYYVNRDKAVLLLQISIILLILLRSPKNNHKTKASLHTTRCSGMLIDFNIKSLAMHR